MNRFGLLFFLASVLTAADVPAFRGAEGFGAKAKGGRGGRVIAVTNLNDSGPGSFREACEAEGPRIVVFRVGGIIELKKAVRIRNPYITIAGQTAPGDGICLRNREFVVETHDAVVRFLRSRAGESAGAEVDSMDVGNGSHDVIYDHCSATWSVDECLSLSGKNQNITVQWCLIAEGLNHSVHKKGAHGYGSLARANGPVTFHHNLWAHNDARNPRMGDDYGSPPFPVFDFRNNVIFDYGNTASGLTQGNLKVNYVANYLRPGPSSKARRPISVGKPSTLEFYIRENIWEDHDAETKDNADFFSNADGQVKTMTVPFPAPQVTTTSAREAFEAELARVGSIVPVRDAVDRRIINEVRERKGRIIDATREVGGYPEYKSGTALVDTDGDGIPDAWEKAHRLDPKNAADGAKDSGDGYTWVEKYLDELANGAPASSTPPKG
jgi:pectate lyase